jgi:hypothetical protein
MAAIVRGTVAGILLFASATGLASQAGADAPDGVYALTVIQGDQHIKTGAPGGAAKFSPCGPDCIHVAKAAEQTDLHAQGDSWAGSAQVGKQTCSLALDNAFQNLTGECPAFGLHVVYSMEKKG